MNNSLTGMIERLLMSKKLILASVPIIANAVAAFTGFDPASKAMLVLDAAFALLVIIQGFLDMRFGSASDGTTPATLPEAKPDTTINVTNAPAKK